MVVYQYNTSAPWATDPKDHSVLDSGEATILYIFMELLQIPDINDIFPGIRRTTIQP